MLFTHLFLHLTLVYGACDAAARQRRPGSSYTPSKSGPKPPAEQGGAVVPPPGLTSTDPQGASNRTSNGEFAINGLGGAQGAGDTTGGTPGGDTTGGTTGGETGGSTGGGSTGGSTGGTPSSVAPAGAASSTPPNSADLPNPKMVASKPDGGSTGGGMKASFTQYSGCNTASVACGWYNNPGYNAAISQAVFGTGPGGGAGPACGTCYQLNPDHPGAQSIVVKINNLCPVDGNPMCSYAADENVNFDLCEEDGAAAALFGSSGTQQVNGTASLVDCGQWTGSGNLT